MPELVARIVTWLLLFIHGALGAWAVAGAVELAGIEVAWPSVTNPELPRWLLLVRWPLIAAAAVVFIGGYASRWRGTPWAMVVIYGGMAAMCAHETFFLLTNESRYWAMAIEYAEYAAILAFLFRSTHIQQRLAGPSPGARERLPAPRR